MEAVITKQNIGPEAPTFTSYYYKAWGCRYCGRGLVVSLPSECPKCGATLEAPEGNYTKEQLQERDIREAMRKLAQSVPEFALAH